jgi:CheY-like chemotaxis protein
MKVDLVYVDDEEPLLRAFSYILEKAGLSVATFSSPNEALDFIAANEVALILCDYRMPGMTGLEFLDAMDKDVPFYLLSGDLMLAEQVADLPRVAGIFRKPLSPVAVAAQVGKILGRT